MEITEMIKRLYRYVTAEKRIDKFRRIDTVARKLGGNYYDKTLGQLKYKLRYDNVGRMAESIKAASMKEFWSYERKGNNTQKPLVSVIVPNFNHAPFLKERLESIYNQTYKNIEVILLDDCSTDSSREILSSYAEKYPEITKLLFNDTNSGRVFKQWNKGLKVAKGDLIWIAESDDYCELDFLEKMTELFCYDSIMLAFARSIFMQQGQKIWSTEEYLHDLSELKWNKPFYISAAELVESGFAIHNVIPNVSSAVFRNTGSIPKEVEEICSNMRLSGDWIFYLNMIKGSVVAYTNETTNYYRIHPQSTSLKIQKTEDYYKEFEQVSCYIARNYKVNDEVFNVVLNNLEEHYRMQNPQNEEFRVRDFYSIPKILNEKKKRTPNIVMACFALRSGGGETFPIFLVNEMRKHGLAVTLLNFDFEPVEDRIVKLIDKAVPVVNMKNMDYIWNILHYLNADIVHSHHASVDYALSLWIESNPGLAKHIITLHGMYEAIEKIDCNRVIRQTWKTCQKYAYVADKNLECFKELNYYTEDRFLKVPNGLPNIEINCIDRKSLGLNEDDFVYVLASRGIPEKGWSEAVQAVEIANRKSERQIKLIILGDGQEKVRLECKAPECVKFLGTVSNVRDYFAMGDAGLLPSRFKGESYPLVIIECLMTGRPVISTSIAEVPNQIVDELGNVAGLMIDLDNWKINIEELADTMAKLANDKELYKLLKQNTYSVSKKFSIDEIADNYLNIYKKVVNEEIVAC